jgi:hypothetical protein
LPVCCKGSSIWSQVLFRLRPIRQQMPMPLALSAVAIRYRDAARRAGSGYAFRQVRGRPYRHNTSNIVSSLTALCRPSRRLLNTAVRPVIAAIRAERSNLWCKMSVLTQSENSFFFQKCRPKREIFYCSNGAPSAAAIRATADICGAVRLK